MRLPSIALSILLPLFHFTASLPISSSPENLSKRTLGGTQLSACSLNNVDLPKKGTSPQVPDPSAGLKLSYVALGRGTQNYTCPDSSESTKPTAKGAVAILYDTSCLVAFHSSLLHELVGGTLQFTQGYEALAASVVGRISKERLVLGHHYFSDPTTPVFDFRSAGNTDWFSGTKSADVPAPEFAVKGKDGSGDGAVDWLKLTRKDGGDGMRAIQEVYRMITAGGKPPADCRGRKEDFEVEYAAEYYFYSN